MFYLAVVLEKGQIVDRSLDPQDEAELVVELQRHRTHRVFDPRSFDGDVIAVAGLAFKLRVELLAQERRNIVRLHRVGRRPGQGAVDRRQIGLPLEHDNSGVLALIHAPVVLDAEVAMDGAVGVGKLVGLVVETFHLQAV
jgi:hypothetical protein